MIDLIGVTCLLLGSKIDTDFAIASLRPRIALMREGPQAQFLFSYLPQAREAVRLHDQEENDQRAKHHQLQIRCHRGRQRQAVRQDSGDEPPGFGSLQGAAEHARMGCHAHEFVANAEG